MTLGESSRERLLLFKQHCSYIRKQLLVKVPSSIRRECQRILNEAQIRIEREIGVVGKRCLNPMCNRKLRLPQKKFCNELCRWTVNNRKNAHSRTIKNPNSNKKRQAKFRRNREVHIQTFKTEIENLQSRVLLLSNENSTIKKENGTLREKIELLGSEISLIRNSGYPAYGGKPYRLTNPEMDRNK